MEATLLEYQWNQLFGSLGEELLISKAFNELVCRYSEDHRHYHTLAHIEACFKKLDEVSDSIDDIFSLKAAIWFHDVIYDPSRNDNEEMSAQYAQSFLNSLKLNQDKISKVVELINLTKHNKTPITDDEKYLLDIDVSILGSDDDLYSCYEKSIRQEYKQIPDENYREGRINVLQSFLDSQHIYYTEYFRQRYEQQARKNIVNAIMTL